MAKIKRQGDKLIQDCVKLKLKVEKFSINTAARGRGEGFEVFNQDLALRFSSNHFLENIRFCVLRLLNTASLHILHVVVSFVLQLKLLYESVPYFQHVLGVFSTSMAKHKLSALFATLELF